LRQFSNTFTSGCTFLSIKISYSWLFHKVHIGFSNTTIPFNYTSEHYISAGLSAADTAAGGSTAGSAGTASGA
jgi:hypothetical protein